MTDDNYKKLTERIEKLEKAVFHSDKKNKSQISEQKNKSHNLIDYSINIRAFVKRYTKGKSGPKRFTLLLSYFAKGEIGKAVDLSEIKKHWGKMSTNSLLGKFNMFYPV